MTIQLSSKRWDDEFDRLGGAGGGRDDAHRCCAGTAQVAVRKIKDFLVVGVGVDSRHEPALDLILVMNDLDSRSQPVCRAGRIRDNMMLGRVIHLIIDAQDNREVLAFGGGRDYDLSCAAFCDVVLGAFDSLALLVHAIALHREDAGALNYNLNAQGHPTGCLPGRFP